MKINYGLIIASLLAALILASCSELFGSSLSQEDIRATAYHLATTQMATTIEPQAVVNSTVDPGLPTPTTDPTYCSPEELNIWKVVLLVELELLGIEVQPVVEKTYDLNNIDEKISRIRVQAQNSRKVSSPRCGDKSMRRLTAVFDQLIITWEAIKSGDEDRIKNERILLIQSRTQMVKALREVFPGEEYRELDDLFVKYGG